MTANTVEYGPYPEEAMITGGLDYYKPTMSQLAHEIEPDAEVTFTFKNRGEQRLADYIDAAELQARFDRIVERGFSEDELHYLAGIVNSKGERVFYDEYLSHLSEQRLPEVQITMQDDDLHIETTGEWSMVTFWETVVMSQINESYFEGYMRAHNIDPLELYEEGDQRLSDKIATLQANPNIKIVDFGSRRHFSYRWHCHVLERLINECPENLIGTSNVAMAHDFGIKPIGTFAHEMPMVYAGLADGRGLEVRGSHHQFLEDWYSRYGEELSIALTDTFGTDFFFADFTEEEARDWRGLRQDLGDPIDFGERAIEFYEAHKIDPTTKTIIFSEGLDIDRIVELHNHFKGRVQIAFGWGTTLTNDLGLKPLSIVMKATEVDGTKTVKLSDDAGKHTGPEDKITEYTNTFNTKEGRYERSAAAV